MDIIPGIVYYPPDFGAGEERTRAVRMEARDDRAEHRNSVNREELVDWIARAAREEGAAEPIPGLHLQRVSRPNQRVHGVSVPSFCVIAQGRKEIYLGESRFVYDPEHYLLVTVDLPYSGRIVEASPDHPYLSLRLDLDPTLVGSVMV